jgi:hypothetical protein
MFQLESSRIGIDIVNALFQRGNARSCSGFSWPTVRYPSPLKPPLDLGGEPTEAHRLMTGPNRTATEADRLLTGLNRTATEAHRLMMGPNLNITVLHLLMMGPNRKIDHRLG